MTQKRFVKILIELPGTIFILFVGLTFFVFGLWLFNLGLLDTWRGISSTHWPAVEGFFQNNTETEVRTVRPYGTTISPRLKYTYTVADETYISSRWRFDASFMFYGNEIMDELTGKYFPPNKLQVYYHPRKPDLSVLDPGFRKVVFVPIVTGVFLFIIGYFILRRCTIIKHGIAAIPEFPVHLWKRSG